MAEYIKREVALNRLETLKKTITPIEENRDLFYHDSGINGAITGAILEVEKIPAADVVEVKHGYWKVLIFKGGRRSGQAEAKCSICGRDAVYQITEEKWEFENYCPHCDAKMDGGKENEQT